MKDILIVLLVIAVALLIIGAANNDQRVDLDYIFGTWHQVSLFTLIAIAAGALVVVGLTAAAFAALGAAGDRRKLERELEQTYGRLRDAEAHGAQMAAEAAAASAGARREELPVGGASGASSAAAVADAAAGPDDSAAGPYDGAAGSDDRTRALRHQPGRDDT